jgi:hypothetical protein
MKFTYENIYLITLAKMRGNPYFSKKSISSIKLRKNPRWNPIRMTSTDTSADKVHQKMEYQKWDNPASAVFHPDIPFTSVHTVARSWFPGWRSIDLLISFTIVILSIFFPILVRCPLHSAREIIREWL